MVDSFKLKRNFKIFTEYYSTGLFLGLIACLGFYMLYEDIMQGKSLFHTPFLVVGTPIFLLACYSIYFALSNFPSITISKTGIQFKTIFKSFSVPWEKIKSIHISRKRNMNIFLFAYEKEATVLLLKDGDYENIYLDYYKNSDELNRILTNIYDRETKKINLSQLKFSIPNSSKREYYNTNSETEVKTYKGPLFTLDKLTIWLFLLISFGTLAFSFKLYLIIGLFFKLGAYHFIYFQNYFIVSANFITARNSFLFWKKNVFKKSEIKELVFQSSVDKIPPSIRIILNDYSHHVFHYEPYFFSKNDWTEMALRLFNEGVQIRDEDLMLSDLYSNDS